MENSSIKVVLGMRINNPANIRKTSDKWLGLVNESTQNSFCEFTDVVYGIRALMKLIATYVNRYDLHSIDEIISRYAPSNENDTLLYIDIVKRLLDEANPCYDWNFDDYLVEVCFEDKIPSHRLFYLCQAICMVETNYTLTWDLFKRAYKLI